MKIICVGRNYVEHIKELGNKTPDNPVIFFKTQDSLSFKNEIKHPNFTKELHHEIELVYKISKGGKNIKKVKLKNYISEIGLGIDFTARDIQNSFKSKGLPWSFSKSFDDSAPISNLIKIDKFNNLDNIIFSLKKNDLLVQKGNSNLMIYNIEYLIEYISKFITLEKGDLIFSGTPKGVGKVEIGDKLEGFINDEKLLDIIII